MNIFFTWLKNGIKAFINPKNTSEETVDEKPVTKIETRNLTVSTHMSENLLLDEQKLESFEITIENEKNSSSELSISRDLKYAEVVKGYEKISYITDLHLLHKLKHHNATTKDEIKTVIENIVLTIINESKEILLIGGDVSSDFKIFEMFVKELYEKNNAPTRVGHRIMHIFFVLGNHELWDFPDEEINVIVYEYKKLLYKYGIQLIHNEVVEFDYFMVKSVFPKDAIMNMSKAKIRELYLNTNLIIAGGMGCSGYNSDFNANNGIYKTTMNREQEIEESKIFEELYNKILDAIPDKKVIVFTHMPMNCWREKVDYHSGYVYVSGHTHNNTFWDDGTTRIYADNQIGYGNNSPHVKWFEYDRRVDYFLDYEDGIHRISKDDYLHFYSGRCRWLNFNSKYDELYMLKKRDYYCFIVSYNGNLSILNGGKKARIKNYDIKYYYDNMDKVILKAMKPLEIFTSFQKSISSEIQRIGGDGKIHGCIIDVDFFNHIFVNPYDLKITYYWAENKKNKVVFSDIKMLLKESKNYEMYQKYIELSGDLPIIFNDKGNEEILSPQPYYGTEMYYASDVLCKWQRLYSNILTEWIEPNRFNGLIESKSKIK